jgi:hypothetical protein
MPDNAFMTSRTASGTWRTFQPGQDDLSLDGRPILDGDRPIRPKPSRNPRDGSHDCAIRDSRIKITTELPTLDPFLDDAALDRLHAVHHYGQASVDRSQRLPVLTEDDYLIVASCRRQQRIRKSSRSFAAESSSVRITAS